MNQVSIKPTVLPAPAKIEFVRAKKEAVTSLALSIDGLPKTGKTELMLSMPKPLCIHNFNYGLKGLIDPHIERGEEIYVCDYPLPVPNRLPGVKSEEPKDVWERFSRQFLESLRVMKSVGVDMGGEAWDLVRLARLGKLTQVLPVQYTAVNAEFRQLIQEAIRSGVNVVFLHKLKPEYKNDVKTGQFERAGFGDIGFDMEAVFRVSRDFSKRGVEQFSGVIEECRANFAASGRGFGGADITFSNIAQAVYPSVDPDIWG